MIKAARRAEFILLVLPLMKRTFKYFSDSIGQSELEGLCHGLNLTCPAKAVFKAWPSPGGCYFEKATEPLGSGAWLEVPLLLTSHFAHVGVKPSPGEEDSGRLLWSVEPRAAWAEATSEWWTLPLNLFTSSSGFSTCPRTRFPELRFVHLLPSGGQVGQYWEGQRLPHG